MLRAAAILALCLLAHPASAEVEFTQGKWVYGQASRRTLKSVGVITGPEEITQVTLNFGAEAEGADGGQIRLKGAHVPLGLSLLALRGQCLTIFPGKQYRSLNLHTACEAPPSEAP